MDECALGQPVSKCMQTGRLAATLLADKLHEVPGLFQCIDEAGDIHHGEYSAFVGTRFSERVSLEVEVGKRSSHGSTSIGAELFERVIGTKCFDAG